MNIKQTSFRKAVGIGLAIAAACATSTSAFAQFGGPPREVLAWSHADSRPHLPQGRATGLFIWHDRNTVHVETTDNHWFGDSFEGIIEIKGGKFDNVKSERDRVDTRFRQLSANRLAFHFSARDGEVGAFKFNIHGGDRLIIHVGEDGHRTGRIYYGASKTPSFQDPVVFNLNN